jgi:hypothetical protein
MGALLCAQVMPESAETKMGPLVPAPPAAATSLVPSADEATATQFVLGARLAVQVWARAEANARGSPQRMAPTIIKCFIPTMLSWVYEVFLYADSSYLGTWVTVNIESNVRFSQGVFEVR